MRQMATPIPGGEGGTCMQHRGREAERESAGHEFRGRAVRAVRAVRAAEAMHIGIRCITRLVQWPFTLRQSAWKGDEALKRSTRERQHSRGRGGEARKGDRSCARCVCRACMWSDSHVKSVTGSSTDRSRPNSQRATRVLSADAEPPRVSSIKFRKALCGVARLEVHCSTAYERTSFFVVLFTGLQLHGSLRSSLLLARRLCNEPTACHRRNRAIAYTLCERACLNA